jgi:hypothetical protein
MRRTIRDFGSVEDYILAQSEVYGDEGFSLLEAQLVRRLNGKLRDPLPMCYDLMDSATSTADSSVIIRRSLRL